MQKIYIWILFCILLIKGDSIMNFYKNIEIVKHPNSILVLVNKNHRLDKNYVPTDLSKIDITYAFDDKFMRKEAKEAFEKLSQKAKSMGYRIVATSTYRSYDYQEALYNQYIKEKGLEYADLCSARKGHSEHQTGLAVDVEGSNEDYDEFEKAPEFEWMKNHAHEYGFILRYPPNKTNITGFKYEPWHYRYVGCKAAREIYEKQITLEEYLENLS